MNLHVMILVKIWVNLQKFIWLDPVPQAHAPVSINPQINISASSEKIQDVLLLPVFPMMMC